MPLRLICAVPEPGCPGAPRGLFYEDTPEGRARAKQFAEQQDRPGWGVFEMLNGLRDDIVDHQAAFADILERNGFRKK
jgi:hypothetical protein